MSEKSCRGFRRQRVLPVVGWLQVGVAAAGLGIALAAAPTAVADDQGHSSSAVGANAADHASRATASGSAARRPAASGRGDQPDRISARPESIRRESPSSTRVHDTAGEAVARDAVKARGTGSQTSRLSAEEEAVGQSASASVTLAGGAANTNPTLAAIPMLIRLQLDDLFGGSKPPPTVDSTAVITGLFQQMMRADPTADELQTYLNVWRWNGINGVVAGLYSSTAFRQSQVNNYYLELLNRNATADELRWGTFQLELGVPEPQLAASIAGSTAFYAASSAGGGPDGAAPSAQSFVNLLYRGLQGTTPDPVAGPVYVQQAQAGWSTGLIARQFVTTDPFRQVKVLETFQVLGLSPTPDVVNSYVQNWFWNGGLSGISTQLLASGENAVRIQQGLVELPDMVAAAQLQALLLAPYNDGPDGFNALFNQFFNNPTADSNCKKTPDSCANPGLYELITTGGVSRGIPNSSVVVKEGFVPVADLVPSQNEISLASSLGFPLGKDPDSLRTYFLGGNVTVANQLVLTSVDGQYVVDGHHRWSQLFLINPFASIGTTDIGYVPNPKEALRETQLAIAAQTGYLGSSSAGSDNLFTMDRGAFDTQVAAIIDNGKYPDGSPDAGDPTKPAVFDVFTEFLGLAGQTDDEKMVSIQNYLWGNVLRMRDNNFYITDAPVRDVMPQTNKNTFQPVLGWLESDGLSYSFPTISYLG